MSGWREIEIENLESARNYIKLVATTLLTQEDAEFNYLVTASAYLDMAIKKAKEIG